MLKQKVDMEETVEELTKQRQLIEVTSEELKKINFSDFNFDIMAHDEATLKSRL